MARRKQVNNNAMSPSRRRAERVSTSSSRTHAIPPKRMSGRYLTLALMGGAAVFIIRACNDTQDTDDDDVYYASVQECIADGNASQICNDAWNNAIIAMAAEIPSDLTQTQCLTRYEECDYIATTQRWMPKLKGFMLNKQAYKEKDDHATSHSSHVYVYSSPVRRSRSAEYNWHSSTKSHSSNTMSSRSSYSSKKSPTVSRGGFGHSSSSRGHWGG